MSNKDIKIGITQGDINGIGYELIIKTLMDNRISELCTPIVYGSPKVAAYHRKAIKAGNFSLNNIKDANDANPKRPNIINCADDSIKVELGKPTKIGGDAAYKALKCAVKDLYEGKIDALVTAPIDKDTIQSDDFKFPGHTEYIANFADNKTPLMFMVGDKMKVGVATSHIPLNKVSEALSQEVIIEKVKIMNQSLKKDFGINKPKIAVLGLNPHAGDNGLLGTEDKEIIEPAVEKLRKENSILCYGPYPADGFFGSSQVDSFDAILAMYHDQGLIPFKISEFEYGVNYTAGLPVIRTSPAHGTGYEIAGKGIASEKSFRQALYMAIDIYKNRNLEKEISKNPLPSYDKSEKD